jgi:diadenosine tetraphosphate (Ap4A) HIT family hydrolase
MDIAPMNDGHVLVVPLTHAESLGELDEATSGHMLAVGRHVSRAIRSSGVRCEGVFFFIADGTVAGQEVPHVHLHVVPRFRGDGIRFVHPSSAVDRHALERTALMIAKELT